MARTLDFVDHRRDLGSNRYIYAVVSRRAQGLSIGVNLNVDKVCNFDCPYCQVDRTTPAVVDSPGVSDAPDASPGGAAGGGAPRPKSPVIDLERLESELATLLGWVADGSLWVHPPFDTVAPALRRVADIAFAGDGEPTSPPAFPGAVERVLAVRARFGLDGSAGSRVPLRLLTNATLLHRERVRGALGGFDEVWAKLDAGTEPWFHKVDGTTIPLRRVLTNLAESAAHLDALGKPIVIQAMFCAFDGVGPDDVEIDAWLGRLEHIRAVGRIGQVQIYTVARKPADTTVGPMPRAWLDVVGEKVRAKGIPAVVYGG
jgi:wyosine [tRNA(Phe)-imidazoG37] synthetase (radical SAM superfamily)